MVCCFQHGTCPICRKSLGEDAGREDNNQVPLFGAGNGGGGVGRNLAALFRYVMLNIQDDWCFNFFSFFLG